MKKSKINKKIYECCKENSWGKFRRNHLKKLYTKTSNFVKFTTVIITMLILGTGFYSLNHVNRLAQKIASQIHIENPGNKLKLIFLPDSSEIRLQ